MNNMNFNVLRMAPGFSKVKFEVVDERKFTALIGKTVQSAKKFEYLNIGRNAYEICGLENKTDYLLILEDFDGIRSLERPFRCGEYPGDVINYIHPEDKSFLPSGRCPASPSIVETLSGVLFVSHDIFDFNLAQNQTKIFYSNNNGESWHFHSEIEGCLWGKLFIYRDDIYILGCVHEYGDLVLYKLDNDIKIWEKSCCVLKGGNRYTGGPHKAPMPIIEHNDRIWTAIEFGSWNLGGHACGFVSASGDITKVNNWVISGFAKFDSSWENVPKGNSSGCIEVNIVIKPDGSMIDFLRFGIDTCEPNYGKALYMSIDINKPEKAPEFGKIIDFHGNHTKFCIYFDKITLKYWTIVNKADRSKPKRRNELLLMSSKNIEKWTVEKTLFDYENNGWYEDFMKTGFQYVDFLFHEDYIFFVSRTAINGARNYHDSNCITFHKTRYK